jgi:hypothetical protein
MSATQKHIEKAIGQIQHKEPLPEIDFTQHQLENGFTISTQERVVKEVQMGSHSNQNLWGLQHVLVRCKHQP